jgi:pimeloyl-ACP methyl ester carboxylesterase
MLWRSQPRLVRVAVGALICLTYLCLPMEADAQDAVWPSKTYYCYAEVEGKRIFYREAGDPSRPTVRLLHGYPASSHSYRELIPLLSGRYHVIAPDYLGFGFSDHPDPDQQIYTFERLAKYVTGFIETLGMDHFVIYMQDFGAPVGYRVILQSPAKLRGLIVQNANAYMEGLAEARQAFFLNANKDRTPEGVAKVYDYVSRDAIINRQYLRDVRGKEEIMSPDSWTFDLSLLETEKDRKIQVQLFQDYYNNLLAYPTWQAFLREHQPPTLIVWGKNDPAFIAAGAEAYLRDLPNAELHLIDAGHFAVEEKPVEIAKYIVPFMDKLP